ncbi:hypothetical protein [Neobacillus endophyticus]|nr:hypothetical protein [Neobacillus endophyticus]
MKKHAPVIIGAPYGGVKKQGSVIYAQNRAGRQFSFHVKVRSSK